MANEVRKKDSDLPYVLVACGVFTATLFCVDVFYHNMHVLWHSWVAVPFTILHIMIAVLWVIVVHGIEDPRTYVYRKLLLGATVAALLLVLAHRAGYISDKMDQETIDETKKR